MIHNKLSLIGLIFSNPEKLKFLPLFSLIEEMYKKSETFTALKFPLIQVRRKADQSLKNMRQ